MVNMNIWPNGQIQIKPNGFPKYSYFKITVKRSSPFMKRPFRGCDSPCVIFFWTMLYECKYPLSCFVFKYFDQWKYWFYSVTYNKICLDGAGLFHIKMVIFSTYCLVICVLILSLTNSPKKNKISASEFLEYVGTFGTSTKQIKAKYIPP